MLGDPIKTIGYHTVEIKLGYQGQLESVCKGEISNIEMVLSADGPTRLIIAGVDKGHAFDKGTFLYQYDPKNQAAAIMVMVLFLGV